MTRIINRPVEVSTGPGGAPAAFRMNRVHYRVREVLDQWCEAGRWWEQESEQIAYRVSTGDGGIYELTFCPARQQWHLYKSYD